MLSTFLLVSSAVASPSWSPLRVYIDCQSIRRVDACTYLQRSVDGSEVLTRVPRSDDQVTVQINVTIRASDDLVHLRFSSELPGAPPLYERTVVVDTKWVSECLRSKVTS